MEYRRHLTAGITAEWDVPWIVSQPTSIKFTNTIFVIAEPIPGVLLSPASSSRWCREQIAVNNNYDETCTAYGYTATVSFATYNKSRNFWRLIDALVVDGGWEEGVSQMFDTVNSERSKAAKHDE